jgi:hypothetical protein
MTALRALLVILVICIAACSNSGGFAGKWRNETNARHRQVSIEFVGNDRVVVTGGRRKPWVLKYELNDDGSATIVPSQPSLDQLPPIARRSGDDLLLEIDEFGEKGTLRLHRVSN